MITYMYDNIVHFKLDTAWFFWYPILFTLLPQTKGKYKQQHINKSYGTVWK